MVKLSLSSWLNPSSTTRDEAVATAERKKQNRRTFSGFSSQQQKSSKGADGKAAAAATLQEKQASLQPKDSHPSLSSAASTSAVEPNSNQYDAMASTTSMTALADIISKETAKLEKYMKENNLPMPSFQVDAADDFPKLPNDMQRSRLTIMHATKQLRDLTVGPRESLRWGVWEVRYGHTIHAAELLGISKRERHRDGCWFLPRIRTLTEWAFGSFLMLSLCRLSTTTDWVRKGTCLCSVLEEEADKLTFPRLQPNSSPWTNQSRSQTSQRKHRWTPLTWPALFAQQ